MGEAQEGKCEAPAVAALREARAGAAALLVYLHRGLLFHWELNPGLCSSLADPKRIITYGEAMDHPNQ